MQHTDCAEVDELLLELADYKNDYADMAADKPKRTSRKRTHTGSYKAGQTSKANAGVFKLMAH